MKKLFVILLAALLLTVSGCGLLNKASSGTQASELDGTSSVGTAQQSGTPSTAAPSSDAATQSGAQSAPES